MSKPTTAEQQERAALLMAEDRLTQHEIAVKVGVSRQTINNWLRKPDFVSRLDGTREEIRKTVRQLGIAVIEDRVKALHDRWRRMNQIVDERAKYFAEHETFKTVPGATTGLLAHSVKMVGVGKASMPVDHFELDAALLKELRAHEEQAARELGQWAEKHEVTGKDGAPIAHTFDLKKLNDDELDQLHALRSKALALPGAN